MNAQITDIRRQNLAEWFRTRDIPEKEKSYISQLKTGKGSFGEKAARRLERDYEMPAFYLDTPQTVSGVVISNSKLSHSPITNNVGSTASAERMSLVQDEPSSEHYHRLEYLDVRAAAGLKEYANSDYPETIKTVWLSDDGMLELVGKRRAADLRIINVPTDSMEPTIPKGSPVIIDTAINSYIGDGIYAFSIEGNLFIKRLQKRIKGGFLVISDNKPKYQDEEMDNDFLDNAVFVGKFIKVWKIEAVDL